MNFNNGNNDMQNSSIGYVRVLHAVPDAPNVDIYANDNLIARDLAFSEYTDYIPVPEGTYTISLYVTGTKTSPVLTNMLRVNRNTISTVAAVGTLSTIGFLAIAEPKMSMDPSKSMIRFIHLSPNAPAVDITLPDGTILFRNVSYKQLSQYMAVNPANYTLQVRLAGTSTVVLTVPGISLQPNKYYTVYAIGLVGEDPELEALLLLDENRNNNY